MSFRDAACHVWAIDGYINDNRAKQINDSYEGFCNQLNPQTGSGRAKRLKGELGQAVSTRDNAVEFLVEKVRQANSTERTLEPIIVYGGFRNNQPAPEHMWIEYLGRIYDTMPGYVLFSVAATDATRIQPFLERDAFQGVGQAVGRFSTFLTVNQKNLMDNNIITDNRSKTSIIVSPNTDLNEASAAVTRIEEAYLHHRAQRANLHNT